MRGFFLWTREPPSPIPEASVDREGRDASNLGTWRTANARHAPSTGAGEASNNHPWLPGLLPLSLEHSRERLTKATVTRSPCRATGSPKGTGKRTYPSLMTELASLLPMFAAIIWCR